MTRPNRQESRFLCPKVRNPSKPLDATFGLRFFIPINQSGPVFRNFLSNFNKFRLFFYLCIVATETRTFCMEIEKVIRVVILLVVVVQFGVSVAARILTPNAEIHLPWVTLCLLPLLWPGTQHLRKRRHNR